jgi:formamidopyrimidine-DNA glycosylase
VPELPEVETMRRGILAAIGRTIENVTLIPTMNLKPLLVRPSQAAMRRRVIGKRITDITRRGKRLLVHLESNDIFVFEPRMTGVVLVADPPDAEHLRFQIDLHRGPIKTICFWDRRGLGSVQLLSASKLDEHLGPGKLGPDALEISLDAMRDRLGHSRRAIKVALLDQGALAGIGNLYASELLHVASVHPERRCDLLNRVQWQKIHKAMLEVLRTAIQYEGSTLSDGTYRNALNNPGGYQNHHRVYDRAGETCPTCRRGKIKRIVQAQRSTFFCPKCQTRTTRKICRK